MKRKQTDNISLVYAYGVGEIISGLEHAYEEQARNRALWDKLIDIDHAHDVAILAAASADDDRLVFLRDEIYHAGNAVRAALHARAAERKNAREKAGVAQALNDAVNGASSRLKTARGECFQRLGAWRKANPAAIKEFSSRRFASIAQARNASGCYWCNYNRVIQSFDASRTRCIKQGLRLRYSDPDRDNGCLTVQIQRTRSGLGAAPVELQDGSFSALQIGRVAATAYYSATPRGQRSRLCQTTLEMRVDAEGHTIRAHVWMHRRLPADCRVKSAQLTWRDGGARGRQWQLALTISTPKAQVAHTRPKDVVGIDVGWRIKPDGSLRVAYWYVSDREQGELVLPARMMEHMDWVDQTKADIDNEIVYGERAIRKAQLLIAGGRRKDLGERRELYRMFARRIAQRYGIVAVEQIDLARIALRGAEGNASYAGRKQRQRAGVHYLLAEIRHQCAKHGATCVPMTGPSTMQCHHCGKIGEPADRAALYWTCGGCDRVHDQDQNAAINLMLSAAQDASAPLARQIAGRQNKVLPAIARAPKRSARKPALEAADAAGSE